MTLIELRDISFRYYTSKEFALRNISFTIDKGAFVLITGLSQSGKTTLSAILKGIIPAIDLGNLQGEYLLKGKPFHELSYLDSVQTLGYLFSHPESQRATLTHTVFDEVAFSCENLNYSKEETLFRVTAMSRMFHLESMLTHPLLSCSQGQLSRVALASMLVLDPSVILCDEPLTHLDSMAQQQYLKLIQDLKHQGKTIIVFDHQIAPYSHIIDKLIVLNKGKIEYQGQLSNFVSINPLQTSKLHQLVSLITQQTKPVWTFDEALEVCLKELHHD